jgi:hypothetical protein
MIYIHSYYIWQAVFWVSMAVFVKIRQDLVWRWGIVGTILYLVLNVAFQVYLGSAQLYDFVGVVFFAVLLVVTEALKFYGTLKAIRTTEKGRVKLSEIWDGIKDGEALKDTATFVLNQCSCAILDRSKDLGKWKANIPVLAEPPKIHQPTSDFDELYLRASTFNDFFQMWIESIFLEPENCRNFVYKMIPQGNFQGCQPLLKGRAIRGLVKRPHRAIAKVYI